ncbi:MAG: DUF4384 domain-containing protein [Myxococcaceae bacterium]
MAGENRRIKDPLLEKYAAGGLTAEARAEVEKVLAESEPDRARLAELEAESRAFLTAHPPGPLVERYEKTRRKRSWWHWPLMLSPALAAATAVLVVMLTPNPVEEPEYTTKGTVTVSVHKKQGDSSVQVEPGQVLHPGDAVRFEVRAGRPGYVAVIGRDARGNVTVYHPWGGTEAARYRVEEALLPTAIELDEVTGTETLYALYAEKPFSLGWAVEALRANRPIQDVLPEGVSVARTELQKQ